MQRTKLLRLQKPEPGDEYNSATLTQNVKTIDKIMANIGGNVKKQYFDLAKCFKADNSSITVVGGGLTVYGNGLAFIEIIFENKKDIPVDKLGMCYLIIGNMLPEFATAITQPLTSGGLGMALVGYIFPDPTRIAIRLLKGKVTGKIAAGSVLQLSGFYPLSEVPKSIGLEQMNPKSFDFEVHNSNMLKVDAVAQKLKSKLPFKQWPDSAIKAATGFKFESCHITRNTNGMVAFTLTVSSTSIISGNVSGDLNSTTVATITDTDLIPDRYVKTVSTSSGRLVQGEINPSTGAVVLGSYAGNNGDINKGELISFAANWVYNGN